MDFALTSEQLQMRDTYRAFCKRHITPEYVRWLDEQTTFLPQDMYDKLAELGTMGICIPQEYGGMGLGHVDYCVVFEELVTAGLAVGFCAGIAEVFGGRPIMAMGTERQKRTHLPRIAAGKEKWALAMTEASGGTDILGAIRTTAVRKGAGCSLFALHAEACSGHLPASRPRGQYRNRDGRAETVANCHGADSRREQ